MNEISVKELHFKDFANVEEMLSDSPTITIMISDKVDKIQLLQMISDLKSKLRRKFNGGNCNDNH